MYGDVVMGCKPEDKDEGDPVEVELEKMKRAARPPLRHRPLRPRPQGLVPSSSRSFARAPAKGFPDDRASSSGARSRGLLPPGVTTADRLPGPLRHPDSWGTPSTCSRSWSTATAATPPAPASLHARPGQRPRTLYGEFLVNAAGEDVVTRVRTRGRWPNSRRSSRRLRPAHGGAPDPEHELRDIAGLRVHGGTRPASSCCRRETASAPA